MEELRENLREVISILLEDGEPELEAEFVGTEAILVRNVSAAVLKPREVARPLEKLGFVEVRQRGSHKQYRCW